MSTCWYFDASVILRLLLQEKGASPPFSGKEQIYSSDLVDVEIFRALETAHLTGRIDTSELALKMTEATALLEAIERVVTQQEIIRRARASFPLAVRALDAIHIASAEWLKDELGSAVSFWTHDRSQGEAAMCRGFEVSGL
jgi:predicted nucleic acid-binding protein